MNLVEKPGGRRTSRLAVLAIVGALALLAAFYLGVLVDDEESPEATPSTEEPRQISVDEAARVVWPDPEGTRRYETPQAAALGFARELAGMTDAVAGQPTFTGESDDSAAVQVTTGSAGPRTSITTNRLSDDRWWVVGATSRDIRLDEPIAGTAIDHPLQVSGRSTAFEGTVQVAVHTREGELLGEGFVTGGAGPSLGPFEGEVSWENPGGGWGVVLLYTVSAEDGSVEQATAVPVGFIGGD